MPSSAITPPPHLWPRAVLIALVKGYRLLPSPTSLRTSATTRTKTADAADAILAKMKAYS